MHIPDGYLGPQTYVPAYAAMIPLWGWASSKLKKTLRNRQVPLLALGAAFSFVIMMFNVPIPGGTTGHAVGAVLIAVLLGPWAAMVAVSLALIVQALIFGDGGITAIGANCFNIAVVMPFAGWGAYRLVAGSADPISKRHVVGGAIGGYIGLNAAAFTTAVMFGIQPLIARDAAGNAAYAPFGLEIAVPAMMFEHMVVFGFVEAVVTGLVLAYLQKIDPALLPQNPKTSPVNARSSALKKVALGLGVLILLTPLGLYLPETFSAGAAWGEWSTEEIREIAGYVPSGLAALADKWSAPMPDYAIQGQESASLTSLSITYILSAVLGVGTLLILSLALRKVIGAKE